MTRRLALAPLLALAACQSAPPPAAPAATAAPAAEAVGTPAQQLIARGPDALVVDVRTPAEYASGHLAGARNVDVQGPDFAAQMDSVARDRPVYVYCRSGSRSARARQTLESMGFRSVVNAGGFESLAGAGAPVAE